jgi:hypothetical protein
MTPEEASCRSEAIGPGCNQFGFSPHYAIAIVNIASFDLQHYLAAIESFGMTARSIALHPAQSHEGEESFLLKPALAVL